MTFKEICRRSIRDREGNVVLGQAPNLPIKVAVVAALVAFIAPGTIRIVVGLVAFGAFFTWAWLELFAGTTPLRRVIGVVSLVGLVAVGTLTYTLLR